MNNVFDSPNVDLYHLLGLEQAESNQPKIKKNFSDLIKIFHSDRGGDNLFHQQIVEAYRILSDPSRKFIYDNFGLFGLLAINEDDKLLKMYSDVIVSVSISNVEKEVIKKYIKKKIHKRLSDSLDSSRQPSFGGSDLSLHLSTGLFDYLYVNSFAEAKNKNITLKKILNFNKLSFDNNFSVYKSEDNNREVTINFNLDNDLRTYNSQISYSIDFNNRFKIPFGYELFEKDFMHSKVVIERTISQGHSDILFRKSLTVFSIFKLPFNFTFTPLVSFAERKVSGLELKFDYSHTAAISSQTKIDPLTKTFNLNLNFKKKNKKILTFFNLSGDKVSIGAYYLKTISEKYHQSKSIFLRSSGLFATNESIINWCNMAFRVTSNMQLDKPKGDKGLKFSSSLVLGMQVGSFNIQFPIVIASESNIMSHSFIVLSGLIGSLILFLRKSWKGYKGEHVSIMNKVNREKQIEYNTRNKFAYEKKINLESNNPNGFYIRFAFLGELGKISHIYKTLLLFGEYKNDDDKIFDVKIPLTMHIINSKLNIPLSISDVEGIFIPDYYLKSNLALVIMYSFNHNLFTNIYEINKKEISLP